MYSEKEAKEKVLSFVNSPNSGENSDEFVISSIRLSPREDFWIVQANCRAYVEFGDLSKCYVGVGAYMLNAETGEIEIIGSAESPDNFLQDVYDERIAGNRFYALKCSHDLGDKRAIVNLHKMFNCPLVKAKELIRSNQYWFTRAGLKNA